MKLAAVIVETRKEVNLIKIINDHRKYLPENTDLFIFHGKDHKFLKTIFPKATLIEITYKMNEREYNRLLTSAEFWERFLDYEHLMVFQSDGGILKPGIEEFYEWDYVGAPFTFQTHGGNGGESLRTPRIMYDICKKYEWDEHMNEDIFFSNILHNHPTLGKLAPREICMKWGTETIMELNTFCYHAINKYLNLEECELIMRYRNSKSSL